MSRVWPEILPEAVGGSALPRTPSSDLGGTAAFTVPTSRRHVASRHTPCAGLPSLAVGGAGEAGARDHRGNIIKLTRRKTLVVGGVVVAGSRCGGGRDRRVADRTAAYRPTRGPRGTPPRPCSRRAGAGRGCTGLDEGREPVGWGFLLRLRQRRARARRPAGDGADVCDAYRKRRRPSPTRNTYLVFRRGLEGADSGYDYGNRFLFQGHEAGTPGSITRINLDADAAIE